MIFVKPTNIDKSLYINLLHETNTFFKNLNEKYNNSQLNSIDFMNNIICIFKSNGKSIHYGKAKAIRYDLYEKYAVMIIIVKSNGVELVQIRAPANVRPALELISQLYNILGTFTPPTYIKNTLLTVDNMTNELYLINHGNTVTLSDTVHDKSSVAESTLFEKARYTFSNNLSGKSTFKMRLVFADKVKFGDVASHLVPKSSGENIKFVLSEGVSTSYTSVTNDNIDPTKFLKSINIESNELKTILHLYKRVIFLGNITDIKFFVNVDKLDCRSDYTVNYNKFTKAASYVIH